HTRLRFGKCFHHATQQVAAHARAADGDDAHLLAVAVAELVPDPLSIREVGGIESRDVAGEVEVLADPVPDQRQSGAEAVRYDVLAVADVDRPVADAREARD